MKLFTMSENFSFMLYVYFLKVICRWHTDKLNDDNEVVHMLHGIRVEN